MHRRCALPPEVFALHVGAACAVPGAIGLGFCMAGYPLVLAFCLLQGLALAAAALCHAVHALDGETLELDPQALIVQTQHGLHTRTLRLNPAWARLERPRAGQAPVLCSGALRIALAAQLNGPQRERFAAEFAHGLARRRSGDPWPDARIPIRPDGARA
nr:DUF2244 domain-containing protein [Xenophilus sp. Marseille-Q4582]